MLFRSQSIRPLIYDVQPRERDVLPSVVSEFEPLPIDPYGWTRVTHDLGDDELSRAER